ncbi:MAG TPA: hypothetical protein VJP87_10255 [Candidatus Acidoferrales bacterium]|nr:hypothetical protein [Candidatus Acidoferrales bacterium]
MEEVRVQNETVAVASSRANWSAIWAGVFTTIAIWSVFGVLGMAIFTSAANPNAPHPVTGMAVGEGIWMIVLTIIAMYVGGRTTGHFAAISNQRDGVIHGMAMFGLSFVSFAVLLTLVGLDVAYSTPGRASEGLGFYSAFGWAGFLSLLFGWLAAMGGAVSGTRTRIPGTATQRQQVTHA